jgi:hypothetical protein
VGLGSCLGRHPGLARQTMGPKIPPGARLFPPRFRSFPLFLLGQGREIPRWGLHTPSDGEQEILLRGSVHFNSKPSRNSTPNEQASREPPRPDHRAAASDQLGGNLWELGVLEGLELF